jgi:hypothetical protein
LQFHLLRASFQLHMRPGWIRTVRYEPNSYLKPAPVCRCVFIALTLVSVAACRERKSPVEPEPPKEPLDSGNHPAFPGFDTSIYPGDATLAAWKWPHSPYRWTGYYLGGPCHRDQTWRGRYASLSASGWGITAIYVGQQDWTQIPDLAPLINRVDIPAALNRIGMPTSAAASTALITCSSVLLSAAQGLVEAQDAAAMMATDGFPAGSTVFLDVEYVSSVNDSLTAYVRAWVRGLLLDGRYRPGIYTARFNAPTISAAARAAYTDAGASGAPRFWLSASSASLGFSMDSRPVDVGYDYASVWQGDLTAYETWAGIALNIDRNVASTISPSAP